MKLKSVMPSIFAAMFAASLFLLQTIPAQSASHRIEVTAKRFEFAPADVTVKKGEHVVLALKSLDVPHGLRIKELGVEAKIAKGQTAEVAFNADKTGTFVGHCSVFCGAGHGSMTLTVHIVE